MTNSEKIQLYDELYKYHSNNSYCLNPDKFANSDIFVFLIDQHNLKESVDERSDIKLNTFPWEVFRIRDGYLYGSLLDYLRFKYRMRKIEKSIKNIKYFDLDGIENIHPEDIESKVLAEITGKEIKIMKYRFKISLF